MPRPLKPIDVEQVKKLAERGWTVVQIAAYFEIDESRIRRRFADIIATARQHGAAKLIDILWQRGVTEKDSRILLNLADRIIGPVTQRIDISKAPDEVLEAEVERRLLESGYKKEV